VLSAEDRAELERRARCYRSPYSEVVRARVVLLAADGLRNTVIAARVDACVGVVSRWSAADLAAQAVTEGLTRSLSRSTVRRWLDADAIRPWRYRSWIFPRDPDFAVKAGHAGGLSGNNGRVASPPASTRTSLGQKLSARARQRWPQLAAVTVRFRGKYAYVAAELPGGLALPLCRLRYAGYASTWGFALYRASHDDYHDSLLPSGQPCGTPEEALDCACGLYLADPKALLLPRTDTTTD
jgi:hypothetical protein